MKTTQAFDVPRMLNKKQLAFVQTISDFNKYHNSKLISWNDIPNFVSAEYDSDAEYQSYVDWYKQNCSKLAKVLK